MPSALRQLKLSCRAAAEPRILHPVDRQPLEEGNEAATRLPPRSTDLLDVMFGARTARHVGSENGLDLAHVQVSTGFTDTKEPAFDARRSLV
jgi:hypothetical protein